MKRKITIVDRDQLSECEKRGVFRLLLTSFSAKFASNRLTLKEKVDILLYLEQHYASQKKSPVDYIVKDQDEIIGVLTISEKTMDSRKKNYPFELSKKYGFLPIFKYLLMLSALEYSPQDKEQYIENVAVHERYQRQGIAKFLILAAQAEVKTGGKLSLIVSANNQQAVGLYLKCGFSIVKKQRVLILRFLANEPNWLFMEWSR